MLQVSQSKNHCQIQYHEAFPLCFLLELEQIFLGKKMRMGLCRNCLKSVTLDSIGITYKIFQSMNMDIFSVICVVFISCSNTLQFSLYKSFVFFAKFISKHLILFDSLIDRIFFISFSGCITASVCKRQWFRTLILYPAPLLPSFLSSNNLSGERRIIRVCFNYFLFKNVPF